MDEFVRFIDEVDSGKIQYHAQEIDGLCNARNVMKSGKDKK